MALLEKEATRFAEALDDYEHVSVTDIGGDASVGYWFVIHDQRVDLHYRIASHCDYSDFVGWFVEGKQWPVRQLAARLRRPV